MVVSTGLVQFARYARRLAPGLGSALLACSGMHHDCVEARDCPGPAGFIEAGGADNWWEPGGAAGEPRLTPAAPSLSDAGRHSVAISDNDSEGGTGGMGGSDLPARDAAPSVLGVLPADGELGVRSDTSIVIYFSEPMDVDSVAAAYESSQLPAAQLDFEWNSELTTLTLTPRSGLSYSAGVALTAGAPTFPAKAYECSFNAGAMSRAGQPLAQMTVRFSTLRRVSREFTADPELSGNWTEGEGEGIHNCLRKAKAPYVPTVCVGDDANDVRYTGFVSFDLGALPADIAAFVSVGLRANAQVYGRPENLGVSRLEHVSFAGLGDDPLYTPALAALGPFYGGAGLTSGTWIALNQDLTAAVADDYARRAERADRSQYRLSFAKVTADGHWDDLEIPTKSIRLSATYLQP